MVGWLASAPLMHNLLPGTLLGLLLLSGGAARPSAGESLAAPGIETPAGLSPLSGRVGLPASDKFWPGFAVAFLMVLFSELGDKTFLIAAIMAMRHSRTVVFLAALAALSVMTVVSVAFGLLLPTLLPRLYTLWAASLLFLLFGVKMLFEGVRMSPARIVDEYDEVSLQIEHCEDDSRRHAPASPRSLESGVPCGPAAAATDPARKWCSAFRSGCLGQRGVEAALPLSCSPVLLQTFSLTFLAEWGDRSQLATIALAAAQNVYGVAAGAIVGHAVCTALAVVTGRLLAGLVSVKTGPLPPPPSAPNCPTVTIVGGFSFILFALLAIL